MTTPNQVLSEVEYDVVGKRPVRPDGVDKVTGRAQYGADLDLTGLIHGRVLRSPHAHARIRSVDTSKAEALAGVRAVVTAADLPFASMTKEELGNDYNRFKFLSDNFLASDKALYRGHAVAAVAADNAHIAEAALALIDVDYEALEPVIDVRAAMQDGAPLLHEDLRTSAMGEMSEKPSNVAAYMKFEKGDTAAGFANSDVIVEREFTTASVHQGYIEPHNATAHWRADGQINIWCSTQGAFVVRANTADVLRVDVSDVRVTPMEIGGGFGGKVTFYLEPVA
ncbi:MAG: xanthine dehydrogenase family protein molybdopterin-binding subunit, partial [Dehalococcoidia bacterium]|nr:xanthine dehydrogenase family protein molybdopterin-binding subunit [Dehalococcoidia bacterium]